MNARGWIWCHRLDRDQTEVLVIFDATNEFDVVSITDAAGAEQVLSDTEAEALGLHLEAHHDGSEAHRRAA